VTKRRTQAMTTRRTRATISNLGTHSFNIKNGESLIKKAHKNMKNNIKKAHYKE